MNMKFFFLPDMCGPKSTPKTPPQELYEMKNWATVENSKRTSPKKLLLVLCTAIDFLSATYSTDKLPRGWLHMKPLQPL